MPSFAYKDDFLSAFLDLAPSDQEQVFAISCVEPSHWEASPNWEISHEELDDLILASASNLLEDYQYDVLERRNQLNELKSAFYHGDMTNQFLTRFLAHELDHRFVPESVGGAEDFDVTMYRDEIPLCDIGIKRMATSSQLSSYLDQHRDKVQSIGEGDCAVLMLYYPTTTITNSRRVRDFVFGYEYLASEIDAFYAEENNYISVIPAPLTPEDNAIQPLRETRDLLRYELGLDR